MLKNLTSLLITSTLLFGALSTSSHYDLNSYSLGAGGGTNANSTTYKSQASLGEQANGMASSTNHKTNGGSIGAEQLSTPQAPTLSNGSGLYYNKLFITLNDNAGSNAYPADITFAIAVSLSPSFTSPSYLQANGSLGASPVFQTYTAWGGASGSYIINLSVGTAYYVEASAKQGLYTNTDYGPYASASTAQPSTTFSVSQNTLSLGSLISGSITTSSTVSLGFSTNGANGGAVYVSGAATGLHSATQNYTIPAYTGNLTAQSSGFGVQGASTTQTSGGPLAIMSPFNGTGNTVGAESTVPQQIFSTSAPVTGGTATANVQAKSSSTTPAATDYSETLTFVAAGDF